MQCHHFNLCQRYPNGRTTIQIRLLASSYQQLFLRRPRTRRLQRRRKTLSTAQHVHKRRLPRPIMATPPHLHRTPNQRISHPRSILVLFRPTTTILDLHLYLGQSIRLKVFSSNSILPKMANADNGHLGKRWWADQWDDDGAWPLSNEMNGRGWNMSKYADTNVLFMRIEKEGSGQH